MKRQSSMSDQRVHPLHVEGAPPPQYPSVESVHANQHDIQLPHDEMHKEEEKGLRSAGDPSVNINEGFDQEAMAARKRRRRRRCVRCCCCVGVCVGTILLLIGILVLLFFLVLHPKLPKYTITDASISRFSMSNTSSTIASAIVAINGQEETVYLNVDMDLSVRMENPNKKIGIDYREIKAKLFYEGEQIGEGSIPAFYQGHKNVTHVELAMQGRDIALTPELSNTLRNTLNNDDSITLNARTIVYVRIKIGSWKTGTSKVRVKCSVQVSNPTRGTVRLLHNRCKFKLLRLRL